MKLKIGNNPNFEIRKYTFNQARLGINIVYLSDLHFNGKSLAIAQKVIDTISALKPHLILLGGDYTDTKAGLSIFDNFIQQLAPIALCKAIIGNHDQVFFKKEIINVFNKYKIELLLNEPIVFTLNNNKILIGTNNIASNIQGELNILLLHKPITPSQVLNKFQLVFAGHLHGCQFVLWQKNNYLYPGALFYKNNFLYQQNNFSNYLISKGLGDTLGIRYNCTKDIIFVQY